MGSLTDPAPAAAARDLALVIVSYNVRDLLRGCLHSLREQAGPSLAVIVVDNRSRDGSAEMVAREFPEVQLLVSARNGGFANGNNQGLRAAPPARYTMLLNPDTVVQPGALAELVQFMDAHPEAGVVGPRLILANGRLDLACRRGFPSPEVAFYHAFWLDRLFPRSRTFARYNLTFLNEDELAEVDSVVGAAMLVRAEALERVGLLDERFFMYGEDLDWAYRIQQAGWKVFYDPAAVIVHYKRQSSRQRRARSTLAFYSAMAVFHRKHYAPGAAAAVNWAIFAGIGLRCLLALLGTAGQALWAAASEGGSR